MPTNPKVPVTPKPNVHSQAYKDAASLASDAATKASQTNKPYVYTMARPGVNSSALVLRATNAQKVANQEAAKNSTETEIAAWKKLRDEITGLKTKVANKFDLKNYASYSYAYASNPSSSIVHTDRNGIQSVTVYGAVSSVIKNIDVRYIAISGAAPGNITTQIYYLNLALDSVNNQIKLLEGKLPNFKGLTPKPDGGDGSGGGKGDKKTLPPAKPNEPTKYNIPSVTEAYFQMTSGYESQVLLTGNANRPAIVNEAKELWVNAGSHKGMIQSFVIPKAIGNSSSSAGMTPELYANKNINTSKYAFQFLYNPGTVQMDYAGAPAVDIGLELSGRDKIPLIGSAATSSTISFQLLINRMPDMKYLGSQNTQANLSARQDLGREYLISNQDKFTKIYGRQVPVEDLEQIRDRGTMYDVEFLLRTLIGYALPSTLRGFTTSDVGYLGAYPVELHLGKSLRYLVTVNSFSLNHTIFSENMVPVFTNMTINCNRLPDYPFNYAQLDSAYSGSFDKTSVSTATSPSTGTVTQDGKHTHYTTANGTTY
jgi:hypothetical protein